jgi:hypothetical protein
MEPEINRMSVKSAVLVKFCISLRNKRRYAPPTTAIVFVLLSTLSTYILITLFSKVIVNIAPSLYDVSVATATPTPANVLIVPLNSTDAIVLTPFTCIPTAAAVVEEEGTMTGRDMVNVNDE